MTPRVGWISCVRLGLATAWRYRVLVVLVWVLFLAASLLAAVPAWRWWNAMLSLAPEGDRLLDGLNPALLRELSHADQSPTWLVAMAPASAFVLTMLVLNPFIAGGLLSVFSDRDHDTRSPVVQFFEAGARCYWWFLRMMLWAGVVGAVIAGLFIVILSLFVGYASNANWEQPFLFVSLLFPLAAALAFWLASLLLDIARAGALRTGERRAWRAVAGSLSFMWRHTGATLAVGVAFVLLMVLTFGVYFAVSSAVTPKSWPAILLMMVWQQALTLTRTGLRVSMLAAEVGLVASREALPSAPPVTSAPMPVAAPATEPEPIQDLPPLA